MKEQSSVSESRRELLRKLESIIGNSCYNANIQNWGPGGAWDGQGREFRYPITFVNENGQKIKCQTIPNGFSDTVIRNGYYAFGANELHIMDALHQILDYLESEHLLEIG